MDYEFMPVPEATCTDLYTSMLALVLEDTAKRIAAIPEEELGSYIALNGKYGKFICSTCKQYNFDSFACTSCLEVYCFFCVSGFGEADAPCGVCVDNIKGSEK